MAGAANTLEWAHFFMVDTANENKWAHLLLWQVLPI